MTVEEIKQFLYNFLYDRKIPHKSICAIMGNIDAENSAWKLDGVEVGGYGGFGLCQWTFGRKTQLLNYGIDIEYQCKFLYSELTGKNLDKTGAVYQWISNPADSVTGGENFSCSNKDFCNGSKNINELTKAFCYCWERPAYATNHLKEIRIPSANKYYDSMSYTGNRTSAENTDKNNTTAGDFDDKQTTPEETENANKIENAVKWLIDIANDDSHGYSQELDRRFAGVDYDCSSFVISGFNQAGFDVLKKGANNTSNMKNAFLQCGFRVIDTNKYQRGDILLIEGEHVVCYIGDNKIVSATLNELGKITGGQLGDQTGTEICVSSYYNDEWICLRINHTTFGGNNGNGVDGSTNNESNSHNDNPNTETPPVSNGSLYRAIVNTTYNMKQLTSQEIEEIKKIDLNDNVKMIFTYNHSKKQVGASYTGTRLKFDNKIYKAIDVFNNGFVKIQLSKDSCFKKINAKYIKKVRTNENEQK